MLEATSTQRALGEIRVIILKPLLRIPAAMGAVYNVVEGLDLLAPFHCVRRELASGLRPWPLCDSVLYA